MDLFGSAQPSALSQILAMIPKTGQASMQPAPQQPQMQASAPQQPAMARPASTALSPNGAAGAFTNLSNIYNQANNLQSLPWLTPDQNNASMAGAMTQAAGGTATPAGSALSMLASMFL